MKILIVICDLKIGGGQTAVVRLARGLAANNLVYIYEYHTSLPQISESVLSLLPDNVEVIRLPPFFDWFGHKISGLLNKLRIRKDAWLLIKELHFKLFVTFHNIEIVNTHLYYADEFATKALENFKVPIVLTDHGDYRYVIKEDISTPSRVQKIFNRVDRVIYVSDSNAESLSNYINCTNHGTKIYYGMPQPIVNRYGHTAREKLGIRDDFVFGMVARGIPEKGWAEAIEAFRNVHLSTSHNAHLILVGASAYLSNLEQEIEAAMQPFIHFVGHSSDPNYWIESFDVGLLPTYFPGESLPNSVIEYLSLGKPVIATNVGGISELIDFAEKKAGILIDLTEGATSDTRAMTAAMLNYLNDTALLEHHSKLAQKAFEKFSFDKCLESYQKVFAEMISGRTK